MPKFKEEAGVIKKFLDGASLTTIIRSTKLSQKEVIDILTKNRTTRDVLNDYISQHRAGKFVNFFYENEIGRPKLPENKKRKIRQVRISDEEMNLLNNPSTTEIRNRLFKLKDIEDFCKFLDESGIQLIPDEWLEKHYNKNDPFWQHVYSNNFSKFKIIVSDKSCRNEIKAPE